MDPTTIMLEKIAFSLAPNPMQNADRVAFIEWGFKV
jgi:hypothetical protein